MGKVLFYDNKAKIFCIPAVDTLISDGPIYPEGDNCYSQKAPLKTNFKTLNPVPVKSL